MVVTTTTDREDRALALANSIVREGYAACVQILPARSIYRWKGRIEDSKEFLLIAKTRKALAGKLSDFIRANHSYELPEITVMQITGGLKAYLGWISDETKPIRAPIRGGRRTAKK